MLLIFHLSRIGLVWRKVKSSILHYRILRKSKTLGRLVRKIRHRVVVAYELLLLLSNVGRIGSIVGVSLGALDRSLHLGINEVVHHAGLVGWHTLLHLAARRQRRFVLGIVMLIRLLHLHRVELLIVKGFRSVCSEVADVDTLRGVVGPSVEALGVGDVVLRREVHRRNRVLRLLRVPELPLWVVLHSTEVVHV